MEKLTKEKFESLLGIYSVSHFMGGCSGSDTSKVMYLIGDDIYLVDYTEEFNIKRFDEMQRKEAKEYFDSID